MIKKLEKGLVQVYTGNGKGKTTAAFGLALRASGHGMKSIVIQFMKNDKNYGEFLAQKRLSPLITVRQFGLCSFVDRSNPSQEDIKLASEGIAFAKEITKGKEFDIVILDEINCAINFGLVEAKDILEIMENKNSQIELVLTGRYAPAEIMERADLVTEMKEIKHYYKDKRMSSREGIER